MTISILGIDIGKNSCSVGGMLRCSSLVPNFCIAGHQVRLMSPEYVRPYVKAQKNDDRAAEGIAEAASRPTMRFVDLKSEVQLDIQSLYRVRSHLVEERTTLINQMRAVLLERGLIVAAGRRKFESAVDTLLDGQASGGDADKKVGLFYRLRPRLSRYSTGLSDPSDILIRFSLYQRI